MIPRLARPEIEKALAQFPVVALLGARQVGKTTLAKEIASTRKAIYLDLERPSDLNKLSEPELYLSSLADKLVILDEVQRIPGLFAILRALVDEKRRPGRFLLLGSASPDLLRQSSESLAGRIYYHELSPLQLRELKHPEKIWQNLWLKGGYPESYLANSLERSIKWRESFIQTHLERDIPGFGIRVPGVTLHRFWQMLAHSHSQILNVSRLATSLQVSAPTANHYIDILEHTFMARRLPPYFSNLKKRLIKSPKIYLCDSGLLHALLGITDLEDLQANPIAGASWEGWALEQVLAHIPSMWRPSYYRTSAGAEIDLILERPGKAGSIAVEFKYSASPKVSAGFWNGIEDLKVSQAYVVAPVKEAYPLKENVMVLPIHQLDTLI